ncbi:MAG: sigma-70 family RNA polymerase sigma factor [Thiotrichales bacterium]|nr:sigma-70 family RNA polymerase sigma factor [Thiotrichales bacterium]
MKLTTTVKNLFSDSKRQRQLDALLVQKHQRLYRLAYAWCHQSSQAEDLVQETMLKALESHKDLHRLEHLDAWLSKIMHNQFLDNMRFNRRWQWADTEEIDYFYTESCSETRLIEQQTSECLCAAMSKLPFEQREAISLVDLEGFSYQEIADITSTPIGTVMSRISRGRENLVKYMKQIEKGNRKIVPLRRH